MIFVSCMSHLVPVMIPFSYRDRSYTPPNSPEEALKLAEVNLEYRTQPKDGM